MDSKRKKFTVDDDDDVVVVDRISELPEDVLQHILSFLPTKQVFQSTLLSTRWKHVWTTFPILNFDKTSMLWSSEKKNDPEVKIKRRNFYKFLNKCLRLRSRQSQRPHIKNFTLEVSVQNHKSKSRVDRWISHDSYSGNTAISFSLNASGLLDAEYTMWSSYGPWDAAKIEFLSKMGKSKVFKLSIIVIQDVIIPKELSETLPSPLYNVKHLKLSIPPPLTRYKIKELLDGLLWISPLPDMLVIESRRESDPDFNKVAFEFSYRKPIYKEENPSCGKFLPFPCWRHCLKTVKIESLKGHVDREILYKYFSGNAKTLENFQFHVGGIA
ncbi:uncharacterized protein LOC126727820 [Quercus robur]|uniref:uncharacterized protein LOC126727820 n=1 Tax=Quercus robur TaxID=38942 RepID=UPI002162753E|nr:uncharacterized protein LOC126727820 [Quercus robur]